MDADLTDSVYAMIVLTYATLAATTYIFTTIEARAKSNLMRINELKKGDCKWVWENQGTDGSIPTDGKKPPEVEVREEFDTIKSGSNMKVGRWAWIEYFLFATVLVSAVLLLPVFLMKLGDIYPGSWEATATRGTMVCEQILASLSVPLVGINLFRVVRKQNRIGRLRDKMESLSVGSRIPPQPTPPSGGTLQVAQG
jgi:hypothetical protein